MEQILFIFSQLLAVTAIVLLLWYTIRPVSRRTIMLFNIAINYCGQDTMCCWKRIAGRYAVHFAR